MRVILVTGKGGVGKTTLASASAVIAADTGLETLLVSTDAAHSLADVLDRPLGPNPVAVARHLHAVQLDARYELQCAWDRIASYLRGVLQLPEVDDLRVEELLVVPGLDQVLALARLHALASDPRWDAIVVDCAPSADTLRLLMIPEVLGWYVDRLFGQQGAIARLGRRRIERAMAIPLPDRAVLSSVADIAADMGRLRSVLRDSTTTARVVVTPERLAIAEGQRTIAYLALYGYSVDAVLVNRVQPTLEPDGHNQISDQNGQMARLDEAFGILTRLTVDMHPVEPIGFDNLREIGRLLYRSHTPMSRLSAQQLLQVTEEDDRPVVRIPLPGAQRDDVQLEMEANQLILTLGDHRRTVTLPDALSGRTVVGAGLKADHLEVVFSAASHA